jgi:Anti-sigma factor NepR
MHNRKPSGRKTVMNPQGLEQNQVIKLAPDIKTKIGQQLRLMYSEVVNEGVPDRFAEILRGLDERADEGSKE